MPEGTHARPAHKGEPCGGHKKTARWRLCIRLSHRDANPRPLASSGGRTITRARRRVNSVGGPGVSTVGSLGMAKREAGLKGSGMGFQVEFVEFQGSLNGFTKSSSGQLTLICQRRFLRHLPGSRQDRRLWPRSRMNMPILMLIVSTQRPSSRSSGIRPGSGIRPSTCVDGDFQSCAACVCSAL